METVSFWRGVRPGDLVVLSDASTLIARMQEGKGPTPESYEIQSSLVLKQMNNLAEWRMFKLTERTLVSSSPPATLWLSAKIVDKNISLSLLRDAPDWDPATRQELVDKDVLFLFNAPNNPDNFEYDELTYTDNVNVTNADINDNAPTDFYMKPQREQHAQATWTPAQSGISDQIATLVEYSTEANRNFKDTELTILELGKADNGVIHMLVGRPLASVDVNITSRS